MDFYGCADGPGERVPGGEAAPASPSQVCCRERAGAAACFREVGMALATAVQHLPANILLKTQSGTCRPPATPCRCAPCAAHLTQAGGSWGSGGWSVGAGIWLCPHWLLSPTPTPPLRSRCRSSAGVAWHAPSLPPPAGPTPGCSTSTARATGTSLWSPQGMEKRRKKKKKF